MKLSIEVNPELLTKFIECVKKRRGSSLDRYIREELEKALQDYIVRCKNLPEVPI